MSHNHRTISTDAVSSSRNHLSIQSVAPGIDYLTLVFVNTYFVGEPEKGPWVLVDTGLPHTASLLRQAIAARYGSKSRPAAIILTHGHFDHSGSARELADYWDVPIYAHSLELPYLTGRSNYPPQDPTVGGAIAFLSRFFPHNGIDLGDRINALPEDGSIPGMPGWQWIPTPGHTAGHVSLFRDSDRVLLAGDALTTMDLDSWASQVTESQELSRPPSPLTPDWNAARASVARLAAFNPSVVAAGHGIPMKGTPVAAELKTLAAAITPPPDGRYTVIPAKADATGITDLPPPVPDPLPARLAIAVGGAALLLLAVVSYKKQQRPSYS